MVDDDVPMAFASPGSPGRIVVSWAMLRCLTDREREALLAHERAHLRCRHHLF
ncbi:M48 family metalloprotease [Streptomyces rishiriensis]|uniref:M48 family metalloprotease n=1 Tax=Streptomyces rishiriensis TaxID=68264 RepID=UPI002481EC8E|nr:M48 family metalloprotease [Streptomyces rishiriensis]